MISRRQIRTFLQPYGRNSLCPCGSEKKYKKCCLEADIIDNHTPDDEVIYHITGTPLLQAIIDGDDELVKKYENEKKIKQRNKNWNILLDKFE